MIIVTGSVLASADTVDRVLALSLAHVRRSWAEPGCLSHAVHQDVENPARLFFFEEWEDMGALEAHFAVPESREFVRLATELAERVSPIAVYEASKLRG